MNGTRPSASGKGMISCTCPHPLVKSIRLNGDGREAPLPLDCGHFRDPIVCSRRNGLALAAEHVRLVGFEPASPTAKVRLVPIPVQDETRCNARAQSQRSDLG